ncbi:Helix-turn-helix domain protein [compost metagenome]
MQENFSIAAPVYRASHAVRMHFDISRTTLWRLAQLEGFPEPLKVGRAVRYRIDEIEAFLRERQEG